MSVGFTFLQGHRVSGSPFHTSILISSRTAFYPHICYKFPRAGIAKYHTLDGLKQQESIVSQFWRPVQNQGVRRIGSFWRV